MQIYKTPKQSHDEGLKDAVTGRYIPYKGGSYSRLPYSDEEVIPRYRGFVGMDESLTESISTMAELYKFLSGGVYIPEGPAGEFIQLILATAHSWEGGGSEEE